MIDYSDVITTITVSVGDVVAGGVILLGAYAGFWGIKKVIALFGSVGRIGEIGSYYVGEAMYYVRHKGKNPMKGKSSKDFNKQVPF